MTQVDEAADIIYDAVDTNANIIFGATIDETQTSSEITITVIATGFPDDEVAEPFEKLNGIRRLQTDKWVPNLYSRLASMSRNWYNKPDQTSQNKAETRVVDRVRRNEGGSSGPTNV